MKRFVPSVVWFVAGAVLGQLADSVLFRLWSNAGVFMPIGHWLDSHGGETMVKCWFVLWVNATSWFVAVIAEAPWDKTRARPLRLLGGTAVAGGHFPFD
jgi:hypothetical protein